MNKETVIPIILGALITILGSCVGWLFGSITTLQHNQDNIVKDIHYVKIDVAENKSTGEGIWSYNDEKAKVELETLLGLHEDAHANELAIKNLKIDILERELERNGK